MSLDPYADFVFRAGWLTRPIPSAHGGRTQPGSRRSRSSSRRCGSCACCRTDTDLTVGVEGRTWIAAKGDRNFPDGEVFTGPVETATNGDVRFSFPAVLGGREVEDVRLRFENGRVVKSEAASGEEYLRQMLAMDDGATILGEFAIGTNYAVKEFTRQILFDEKIGGTFHMALGAGYPDTGSTNVSGLHWDMVCDLRSGAEIHADGEPIYRDGRFLASFFDQDLWSRPDRGLDQPAHAGDVRHERQVVEAQHVHAEVGGDGDDRRRALERVLGEAERLGRHLLVRRGEQHRIAQRAQLRQAAERLEIRVRVLAEPQARGPPGSPRA